MTRLLLSTLSAFLWLTGAALADGTGRISAPEAYAAAKQGSVVLVDVRQPEEGRQTGLADGAHLIPMRHPEGGAGFMRDLLALTKGDKDAPIALVCRTGSRSAAVAKALRESGFTHVLDVSEGMAGSSAGPGWLKRELPLVRCPVC
ncbi:MAG: rhodanese-like domain-containing protein [Magnetospirillum sp.]|nr:rhodanese-like domain-containing protein [Magnetospirillum sp.]